MYKARVAIIQAVLTQYRKPLIEMMRLELEANGVELIVLYGDRNEHHDDLGDLVELDWGSKVRNCEITIFGIKLVWQPVLPYLKGVDLIIVTQESKLLVNYVLLIKQFCGGSKVAFWGHGVNFQSKRKKGILEFWKKVYSRYADWWFTYTEGGRNIIKASQFPEERITVVQNAIDTKSLGLYLSKITAHRKKVIRRQRGLGGSNICVFCGGMYPKKDIKFLLRSAKLIRAQISDFELVFIGSGPDRNIVDDFAAQHAWAHALGPLFDEQKVAVFSVCELQLMPGLVGLGILDSFAMGVPLITTDNPVHSPEIEYLINKKNGVMTERDDEVYANTVVRLLNDRQALKEMQRNAVSSARRYSVESMTERFTDGILKALGDLNENTDRP